MFIDSAKYTCEAGHDVNEDSYLCSADKGVFVVADGLGGHSSGERASLEAVDYFEKNSLGGYTAERITALLEGANAEVLKNGDGGKTTVAVAFVEKGNFLYANAGDSRVYYFRGGKIIAQTKDHSVCQASVDMGMIRPEDIRGSEDRSRLLKVLGSEESLNIKKHYPPIRIQNGDAFLVCSDGFWDHVYEAEMEADLLKSSNSETWLKYMLKRHILRAENKGDNYTAICGMIHLDGTEEYDAAPIEQEKKIPRLYVAIGIAAAVAAIILAIVLGMRNIGGGDDDSQTFEADAFYSSQTVTSSNTDSTALMEKPGDTSAAFSSGTEEEFGKMPENTSIEDPVSEIGVD